MRKLAVVFALAMLPLAAARAQPFCPGVAPWVFIDVQASDSFCTYVTWMATTGVTTGCQVIDANNRLYCPDDLVTRKQMSAFMSRLGRDVAFAEGGNAFGTLPNSTAVLGTADGNALDVRVNNSRVMRYEPNSISPNVIGGSPANNVTAGVRGATIAGGGVPAGDTDPNFVSEAPNRVTDAYGTVGGGYANRAGDGAGTTSDRAFATVGGGLLNTASGQATTVGGGESNSASGPYTTVGGGYTNIASTDSSTIGGGYGNVASGEVSTIGGGQGNLASADMSTVGGGFSNTASAYGSTVGGGASNDATGYGSTVGGGNNSTASGRSSTVGGGEGTTASGDFSTIGGGGGNTASGVASMAGGGISNTASGQASTVGGGESNTAGGLHSTVPGGRGNAANGAYSFAAGRRARASYQGAFMWADSTDLDFRVQSNEVAGGWGNATNTFNARATGGVWFVTAVDGTGRPTVGAYIGSGSGTWAISSDAAAKIDVHAIDPQEVLAKALSIEVSRWRYRTAPGTVHIGPMAQDFHRAFNVGSDERSIATVDADGVALAAIQGLNAKLEARVAAKDAEIAALKREMAEMRLAVEVLMARTSTDGRVAQTR